MTILKRVGVKVITPKMMERSSRTPDTPVGKHAPKRMREHLQCHPSSKVGNQAFRAEKFRGKGDLHLDYSAPRVEEQVPSHEFSAGACYKLYEAPKVVSQEMLRYQAQQKR